MPIGPSGDSAARKLELSHLDPSAVQRELMGKDLDVKKIVTYLAGKVRLDVTDRITDITVSRTIEGASTLAMHILDVDRQVLLRGALNNRLDIQVDGLWFRLVKVGKNGDELVLTFEDREIAVLRTYTKFKKALRSKVTRAEFVKNLIREVREFPIPTRIPELHIVQPIQKTSDITYAWDQGSTGANTDKTGGIPDDWNSTVPSSSGASTNESNQAARTAARAAQHPMLTIKGQPASKEQLRNCNIVMHTGVSMGCRRKLLVCSLMTGIQESDMRNISHGDAAGPDSRGIFQQRSSWGSLEERMDVATAARLFFNEAMKADAADPTRPYWDLCQAVQRSANGTLYAQWHVEANRLVTAYGMPGGDNEGTAADANNSSPASGDGSDYIFYRGKPKDGGKKWDKEDSWACIQRLGDEVTWRSFFVSGHFYFLSEDNLFKSKPLVTLTEFSEGVEGIDFDYDSGKKSAEVTITARVGTWLVPPGSVIVLKDMGVVDGRWLVSNFDRSLFHSSATIVLKKPRPKLPEPAKNDINTLKPSWGATEDPAPDQSYGTTGAYVNPLPTKMGQNSEFATVDPEGAPDRVGVTHHAGKDWFAPGDTPVVAPIEGRIVEVKQSAGSGGQIFGGVVKLQQDNGYVWVFRHVQPTGALREGARVQQSDPVATVVTWADNPKFSHCHIEIWRTLSGGYRYENMIDPVLFIQGKAA